MRRPPLHCIVQMLSRVMAAEKSKSLERHLSSRTSLHAGLLTCLDGYMNVALEETEEWAQGRLIAKYGDTFLRGNNGESE